MAGIIQARMEEILELAMNEIIASGYKGKLLGGAVLTGGGAMMKHIQQLTAFKLAMDTRIGIPNEHLAPNHDKTLEHPMYATGIGLVIEGLKRELEELGIPVQKPEPEKVEAPTPEHEEPADPKGGKGTKANKIKDKDKSIEPKKNRFTEWLYKFILIDNEANENDLK